MLFRSMVDPDVIPVDPADLFGEFDQENDAYFVMNRAIYREFADHALARRDRVVPGYRFNERAIWGIWTTCIYTDFLFRFEQLREDYLVYLQRVYGQDMAARAADAHQRLPNRYVELLRHIPDFARLYEQFVGRFGIDVFARTFITLLPSLLNFRHNIDMSNIRTFRDFAQLLSDHGYYNAVSYVNGKWSLVSFTMPDCSFFIWPTKILFGILIKNLYPLFSSYYTFLYM